MKAKQGATSLRLFALAIIAAAACPIWARAAPIDEAEQARLHELIKPGPKEDAWSRIPWRTELWEARREAAEAGKPIFLWEMDGHPLGCT